MPALRWLRRPAPLTEPVLWRRTRWRGGRCWTSPDRMCRKMFHHTCKHPRSCPAGIASGARRRQCAGNPNLAGKSKGCRGVATPNTRRGCLGRECLPDVLLYVCADVVCLLCVGFLRLHLCCRLARLPLAVCAGASQHILQTRFVMCEHV